MKLIIYVFLLAAMGVQAQSVTTDKLAWNASAVFNIATGDWKEEAHQIITDGDTVEWRNGSGTLLHRYTVTEVMGAWADTTQPGSLLLEVNAGARSGNIRFQRTQDKIKVQIIMAAEGDEQNFEFVIQNIQRL